MHLFYDPEKYREFKYHNEKLVKWFAENGIADVLQTKTGYHKAVCENCKVRVSTDGKGYLVNKKGYVTKEQYEVHYTYVKSEQLLEEISDLDEEERFYIAEMNFIIGQLCSHCGQWGLDGWNREGS